MTKIVTVTDRAQKRCSILAAAAAEFARDGFERAQVNATTECAGIGRGNFSLYFDYNNDVLNSLLLDAGSGEIADSTARHPRLYRPKGEAQRHNAGYITLAGIRPDFSLKVESDGQFLEYAAPLVTARH